MKNGRRSVKWLLLCLGIFMLTGCAKNKVEKKEETEKIPVIHIGISGRESLGDELQQMNEKLGDLTEKKIGIRAQLVWTGLDNGDGNSYYKNRQQDVDIVSIDFKQMKEGKEKNLLLDMKSYLGKAPVLQNVIEEKSKLPKEWQDGVYGIPKPLSDLHSNGVILNRSYVEKYQLDVSQIKNVEDLEPFFEIIKREEPEVIPWALEKKGNAVIERDPVADILDGCLSAILYEENGEKVCNLYESAAYENRVRLAERWQNKGYLAKDILTNIESGKNQVISGQAFASEFVVKPDEKQYMESVYKDKVIIVPFAHCPVLDTEDDWVTVWSIFYETKYPKEAVKVLNLLYEDKDVLNLILYGIEGIHYVVLPDGSFDYPEGIGPESVGYTCSSKWKYNTPRAGIWHGMSENLEQDFVEFNTLAKKSRAYGFWLDESEITVDIEKLKEIVEEYTPLLEVGLCDSDTYLETFRQKLREAGSEELVQQVQKQFDEWRMTEKEQLLTEKQ